MAESGVDLGFDKLGMDDDLAAISTFYEIQSKPVVGSPQTEIKRISHKNRTNLKQDLQRIYHEDKRHHEDDRKNSSFGSLPASSFHAPSRSDAVQIAAGTPTPEIPTQILQVHTKLQNPTRYHMQQMQKEKTEEYLVGQAGKPTNAHSLPAAISSATNTLNMGAQTTGGSAPGNPDSPLSVGYSSTATSISEVDDIDLISELISLEQVDANDGDLRYLDTSMLQSSHTMPPNAPFLDLYDINAHDEDFNRSSSSCPADLSESPSEKSHHGGRQRQDNPPPFLDNDQTKMWMRERQKKDSHNIIEKRRRLNINDRIKELGTLLPRTIDPDLRQNKGTILRSTVDYIRRLKRDQEKVKHMEDRQRMLEQNNRKMLLKLQEMDMLMKAHGIHGNPLGPGTQEVMKTAIHISNPVPDFLKQEGTEELMEDTMSPVQGDPMVTLASPLVSNRPQHCNDSVSMEEISEMLS